MNRALSIKLSVVKTLLIIALVAGGGLWLMRRKRRRGREPVDRRTGDTMTARVDPELREALRQIPPLPLGTSWGRWMLRTLTRLRPALKVDDVVIEQREDLEPPLRLYHPSTRRSTGALYWIHGGGFIVGEASQDDYLCAATARALGIVVVSVDYRLAPEHPFPAALNDCHAGWQWVQQHATTLGIEPTRVAIGGESAGGGLAATLVQRLSDEGEPGPIAQWLLYPMLDDRTATRPEVDAHEHLVWNNHLNEIGWRAFLAAEPGTATIPRYAAAARRQDLHGLPPAWIGVGDIDLFYEENRAFAERLRAAGVPVVLEVVPGAPHAFVNWAPDATLTRDFLARAHAWLQQALAPVQPPDD